MKTIMALKELALNNSPMPFFPNAEEIKSSFNSTRLLTKEIIKFFSHEGGKTFFGDFLLKHVEKS